MLQPEFVINVGDVIEGYSDEKAELNAEWDEFDAMLEKLEMPFFRTVGNHDIANDTAKEVWLERHGATYYHFVYRDVLFLVVDSEDPPHYGSRSERGTRVAALLYSLIESAKLAGSIPVPTWARRPVGRSVALAP